MDKSRSEQSTAQQPLGPVSPQWRRRRWPGQPKPKGSTFLFILLNNEFKFLK
jgi:hypothetical protein